jgi:hypothetical protein
MSNLRRSLTRKEKRVLSENGKVTYVIGEAGDEKAADIARKLDSTRQNISQTIQRGMGKFYKALSNTEPSWTPFQVAVAMSQMLQPDAGVKEMQAFIKLFPPAIRKEIIADAATKLPGMKIGE